MIVLKPEGYGRGFAEGYDFKRSEVSEDFEKPCPGTGVESCSEKLCICLETRKKWFLLNEAAVLVQGMIFTGKKSNTRHKLRYQDVPFILIYALK